MTDRQKTIGVLMLDTRFPRLIGDIGNPQSFKTPVLYKTVSGASPRRVVREQTVELLTPFIEAGEQLIDEGADILTTSCGFLAMFQKELQADLSVPVFTSSLLMMPELQLKYGTDQVGILTISGKSLNRDFLEKTGIAASVPVGSTEGGREFTPAILENRTSFDVELCRQDNVNAAKTLVSQHPEIRALLLECTNMPPYRQDIERATGLPAYSLIGWLLRQVS